MNLLKFVILITLFFVPFVSQAEETKGQNEHEAIKGFMLGCITPTIKRDDPVEVAKTLGFIEFPEEQASFFGKGTRMFSVPNQNGNAVLTMPKVGGCSVNIRKIDSNESFWLLVDSWFGEKSPFKMVEEKNTEEGNSTTRIYLADINGSIVVHVSARKELGNYSVQAILTTSRLQKDTIPEEYK